MKILFVDLKYDYGVEKRGLNSIGAAFLSAFEGVGHKAVPFYYDNYLNKKAELQAQILKTAKAVSPDLIFFCLFGFQFSFDTLDKLKCDFKTICWFGDDTWRFDDFTKFYAPHFSFCITTDRFSLEKYRTIGQDNVILSQWGGICQSF